MQITFKGLTFKLLFAIASATLFVGVLIFSYNERVTKRIIENHAREKARAVAQSAIMRIENSLVGIESATTTIALYLEFSHPDQATIEASLKNLISSHPEIYGATIALDPASNHAKKFAPYFFRKGDTVQSADLAITDYNYQRKEWYNKTRTTGLAHWSNPYFDGGGGETFRSTYSVPIFRNDGGKRTIIGVLGADMSLEWLERVVTPLSIFKSGYGFLLDKEGTYISHPIKERISQKTISQVVNQENDLGEIARRMTLGEEGFLPHTSTYNHKPSIVYFMPFGRNGWSLGITCAKDELYADLFKQNRISLFIFIAGFGILVAIIIFIGVSITRPLRSLALVAKEFAAGNFDANIPNIKSRDEIGTLVAAFNTMRKELREYVNNLMEATANKERIESELNIARTIQRESLPSHPPNLPRCATAFDLFATMEPAEKVGGDLFDYFMCDEHRLFFIIGDVSGKGISAAMFMATTRLLLKAAALRVADPALALTELNHKICRENGSCMFVTLVMGMLDTRNGGLLLANAGHDAPLLRHRDGTVTSLETSRGPACGIDPLASYNNTHIILPTQSMLLLFTDGVTEAQNDCSELFTKERLITLVQQLPQLSPRDFVSQILGAIRDFTGTLPQTDDIAMVALCDQGDDKMPIKEESLKLPCDMAHFATMQAFVNDFCAQHNILPDIINAVQLALDELFSNVCKFSYGKDQSGDHFVWLTLRAFRQKIEWSIEDEGLPFNPIDYLPPAIGLDLEAMPVGGQGIHLVKHFTDQLSYVRQANRNCVVGIKKLL